MKESGGTALMILLWIATVVYTAAISILGLLMVMGFVFGLLIQHKTPQFQHEMILFLGSFGGMILLCGAAMAGGWLLFIRRRDYTALLPLLLPIVAALVAGIFWWSTIRGAMAHENAAGRQTQIIRSSGECVLEADDQNYSCHTC